MRSVKALLLVLLASAAPSGAAVFTVTKTADTRDGVCDRDCSLREAVDAANATSGRDVIELPAGVYTLVRTGGNEDQNVTGDLDVDQPLLLIGAGAGQTVIDGNGGDRVLDVAAEAEIFGVTLRHGLSNGDGGGLRTRGTGVSYTVRVTRSVISGNRAQGGSGGGAAQEGSGRIVIAASTLADNVADVDGGGLVGSDFSLVNSTLSGNRAGRFGGGACYPLLSQVSITGSTVALNRAGVAGGGLYVVVSDAPTVPPQLGSSVVAGNTAPAYPDCAGAMSKGSNVLGIGGVCSLLASDRAGTAAAPLDAKLGPLTGALGPTPVHPLLAGSPAIGLVPSGSCPADDQLGHGRTAPCDAGAVELASPSCTPGGAALCLQEGRFRVTAVWSGQNGTGGEAQAVPLTDDSGDYWFFAPDNLELTVKVLNGCAVNGHWWVFTSGLTDLGVDLKVEDLVAGASWTNHHAAGTAYPPRLDTSALAGCGVSGSALAPAGGAVGVGSSVFVPTKGTDTFDGACDHDCSLREAVAAANAHPGLDVIVVNPGVYTLSRAGRGEDSSATGDLDVTDGPLVILGAGADRTAMDGGGIDRILEAASWEAPLEVHGLTVRNGDAREAQLDQGFGGGISGNDVTVVSSHVTGNRAQGIGGGLYVYELKIRDSTVSANRAGLDGGGIGGTLVLRLDNATVSGNQATNSGGGLDLYNADTVLSQATVTGNSAAIGGGFFFHGLDCPSSDPFCTFHLTLSRSIVAGNSAVHGPDCGNMPQPQAGGYNVFGIDGGECQHGATDRAGTANAPLDPRLTPLGDHGGPTPTHALLAGSLAVDIAPPALCTGDKDQRGRPRPADGNGDAFPACDAGAVELLPGCQPSATDLCLGAGDRFRVTATYTAQGQTGAARTHPLALDTGSFWFFDPSNLELTLKVLDGCGVNGRFWVFLTGLTDVGVAVTVEDTATGKTWHYDHPGGKALPTVTDTDALDVCSE